jgi:ADP-ribose pyrophosphatase YjhB (NUDIX family)
MEQRWDAYNRSGILESKGTLGPNERIPSGQYHIAVDVVIRHEDGDVLVVRREYNKPFGGHYDISLSGNVLTGESTKTAAKRMAREMLGMDLPSIKLLCISNDDVNQVIYYSFLAEVNCEKRNVIINEKEALGYGWCTSKELADVIKKGIIPPPLLVRLKHFLTVEGYLNY